MLNLVCFGEKQVSEIADMLNMLNRLNIFAFQNSQGR